MRGIPDTLSMLMARLRDTGARRLYGTGGWQPAWLPLFRRASRVYVALDRDATDQAIVLTRTFGTRGRVLIPPETLVRKAISTTGCGWEQRVILPRSGRFWNGRSRRVPPPGRFRSSSCHRTWRLGI